MINRVIVAGVVSREPELKTTQNGKTLVKLSIHNTETFRNGKVANAYIDFVVWERTDLAQLAVGEFITVEGRLEKRSYEKDGKKVWTMEIGNPTVHYESGGPPRQKEADTAPPQTDWDDAPF